MPPIESPAGRFEFATAARIIFGRSRIQELGLLARELGSTAFVVTGKRTPALPSGAPVTSLFDAQHIPYVTFSVRAEPTIELVRRGAQLAAQDGCNLVIGIGGGSVLDAGKAIAGLVTNGGDPLDYLEVIGGGKPLTRPSLPYIAVPTTAGTGAEVTRNAVLASPEHGVKASLRSPHLLPSVALVDPGLTHTLPPQVTASTGLDALTQLIEPYVSVRANAVTDSFCREGMRRVAGSLRRAYHSGDDAAARDEMALASLLGGLALANAGLGTVHGFASVIGGMFEAPHGAVCAALLPHVMAANLRALRQRQPDGVALARYDEVAAILTGRSGTPAEDGIEWVCELAAELEIPPLARYGLTDADFDTVIARTAIASSTRANPVALTQEELAGVLRQAV